MRELSVYLDTSGVVKRYVKERGTEVLDRVYSEAERGRVKVAFSIWNVGEALGVFDRYHRRGAISEEEFGSTLRSMTSETAKMLRLGVLRLLPITSKNLVESWELVLKYHIYAADALQVASAKEAGCELFLGADNTLLEVAEKEKITCVNIETEPETAMKNLDSR